MVVYLQPPFLPDIRYDRYGDTLESTPARGSTPSRRKKWLGETITDIARKFGVNIQAYKSEMVLAVRSLARLV